MANSCEEEAMEPGVPCKAGRGVSWLQEGTAVPRIPRTGEREKEQPLFVSASALPYLHDINMRNS
jgi:hypothetical protein